MLAQVSACVVGDRVSYELWIGPSQLLRAHKCAPLLPWRECGRTDLQRLARHRLFVLEFFMASEEVRGRRGAGGVFSIALSLW